MKRLLRSHNSIVGGVCAGIAEYLDIDPIVVRLIWGGSIVIYGAGLLPYLLCWVFIPRP